MIIGVGIDVVPVDRFAESLIRSPGLRDRLFTAEEQRTPRGGTRSGESLAARFAGRLAADDRFEVVAPYPFSLVCFRLRAGSAATAAVLRAVNADGRVYLTHTTVHGEYTIRFAVGAPATTQRHVDAAWDLLDRAATAVLEDSRTPSE